MIAGWATTRMGSQAQQDPPADASSTAGLQRLFESRLAIARLGEKNLFGWWRTDDVLGEDGAYVAARSMPKTHRVGRARIAFAVARHACEQRFALEGARHLFRLASATEEAFDTFLAGRLEELASWQELLDPLEALHEVPEEPEGWLTRTAPVSPAVMSRIRELPLGPDSRSLHLPASSTWMEQIELMTAGFLRGSVNELVVPYVRGEESVDYA